MACTFVPDIPYDDTAARRGTVTVGGPRRDLLRHKEFGLDAGKVVGQPGEVHHRRHHTVLQRQDRLDQPHRPGRGLGVPEIALDRCERARLPSAPYTRARLAYSIGSPTGVPVPCASTMPTVAASTPAAANAARYTAACASNDGVVIVHGATVLIGGRAAHHGQDPVTVAQRIRQPLEQHHAQPSERTNPSAATSNARQRPVGDSMPCADRHDASRAVPASTRSRRLGRGRFRPRAGCDRPGARRSDPKNMRCPPSSQDRAGPVRRRSARTPCCCVQPVTRTGPPKRLRSPVSSR